MTTHGTGFLEPGTIVAVTEGIDRLHPDTQLNVNEGDKVEILSVDTFPEPDIGLHGYTFEVRRIEDGEVEILPEYCLEEVL